MTNRVSVPVLARFLRIWLPSVILVAFSAGVVSNWMVRADSPTIEWLQMQATAQAKQVNDLQASSDAQTSAIRERLKGVETISLEHTRKLDDIAATTRWIEFGVFGTLASLIFRRIFPGETPSGSGIATLSARVRKS